MAEHSMAYVAFDTSKLHNAVAIAETGRAGEVRYLGEFETTPAATAKLVRKLADKHGALSCCYEAGPTGYGLYRQIKQLGHDCIVVAPSLIPRKPGKRVKTNRLDALSLAKQLRAGELTAVWVPDERHEAVRELTRARGASVVDWRAKCQQVSSMLLRLGRHYPGKKTWGKAHMAWLAGQKLEHLEQRIALEERLIAVRQAQERTERLERAIREAVPGWSLAPLVTALMALRGIDFIAATGLLAEIGDLCRFRTPRELMAWLGLVPSESSTGEDTRRGPITKAGNRRARQLLIECAWSYRHPPRIGRDKLARVSAAPAAVRDIAWKAQVRLTGRYRSLCRAGKPDVVAITAVARELSGFIWAIARALDANATAANADAKAADADNGSGGARSASHQSASHRSASHRSASHQSASHQSAISSRNGIQGEPTHGTQATGRTRADRRRTPGALPDTAQPAIAGTAADAPPPARTATQPQPGATLARGGQRARRLAGGVRRVAAGPAGGNP
jgi:transposase